MTEELVDQGQAEIDPETLGVAFAEATALQDFMSRWSDAIDSKVVAVFGVASIIAGVAPALTDARLNTAALGVAWVLAAVFWGLTAYFCFLAFKPRSWRVGPDPAVIQDDRWLRIEKRWYQFYRLRDLGNDFERSKQECIDKAWYLAAAIFTSTVEIAAIVFALLWRG